MIEFPKEYYMNLSNNDNLLGRVVVHKTLEVFHFEADIVYKESRKIYVHVGRGHDYDELKEAVDQGVMRLTRYLQTFIN